ncbi:LamG domain-containing protein, partial [Patescibacteria group bacterium]|nr:LamG domain-containing protein [Patescibacteria group bacterium]
MLQYYENKLQGKTTLKIEKQKPMYKNKNYFGKYLYKSVKTILNICVMVGLLLQMTAINTMAIEIEAINVSTIENKVEWGELKNFTDISKSYSEEIVDKIKAIKQQPDLYISNDVSREEKFELADKVSKVSEELVFQNIDEIDSRFEADQLLENINSADDYMLESLKQTRVIETHIASDTGLETVTDPSIIEEDDHLTTKSTWHDTIIPKSANQELSLEFVGIESTEGDDQGQKTNYKIGYDPVGANRSSASYEENKVLYSDFWDNVDLIYTTRPEGIKEDIILKNNNTRQINSKSSGYMGSGNWLFFYELDLENVTVVEEDGQIKFVNKNGSAQAVITSPFMVDNNGEVSENAYFELLTKDEYKAGYQIDMNKFNLEDKIDIESGREEADDNEELDEIIEEELDQTLPALDHIEEDQTSTITSIFQKSLWTRFWEGVVDWWRFATGLLSNSKAQESEGGEYAGESEESIDEESIENLDNEFDQTKAPIEKIGLEEEEKPEEETIESEYKYLVLAVNTADLEYPIDIDPTTYILTTSDVYNTANGKLLSNDITDVVLYDTTAELTSNYSNNKELKSTLALNNSIGLLNPSDLKGLWTFDENDLTITVEDDSSTPADGTRSGDGSDEPEYVTGQVNTALDFQSANNEYVDMGDDDDFSFVGDFAISVWVNPDNLDTVYPVLSKGQTATDREYYLGVTVDGQVEFKAWQLNSNNLHFSLTTPKQVIKPGEWTHIVVTNDSGTEAKLYIDDVARAETTGYTGSMGNDGENFQVGRGNDGTSLYHFEGKIDEVKLYATDLTQNEILNLYENAKSKLVGWWNMQEGGTDYSGQINHGTLTGTTFNANGKVAGDRQFTTSDNINLGNNFSLSPLDHSSVEAWIKTNSSGTIVIKDNEYELEICPDGKATFNVYANSQWQGVAGTGDACTDTPTPIINDNNWHHVVGTYDGSYIRVYVDGKQEAYYYFQGDITRTSNNAVVGNNTYTGEIDELAIYNRILSADEAKQHYDQSYTNRISSITNFDGVINFADYSQLALDDLRVETGGVLKVSGTDKDGKDLIENIKLHSGNIVRVLSSNRFKSITQLESLNEYGEATGEKLQITDGRLIAFSPFHDSNWRHGINLVDDGVTGLWHFDEGSGSTIADSSGANNAGFLAGGESTEWKYSREIDLTPATPLDDFQVKIELPSTFDYRNAQDDGGDLRFYDINDIEQ